MRTLNRTIHSLRTAAADRRARAATARGNAAWMREQRAAHAAQRGHALYGSSSW